MLRLSVTWAVIVLYSKQEQKPGQENQGRTQVSTMAVFAWALCMMWFAPVYYFVQRWWPVVQVYIFPQLAEKVDPWLIKTQKSYLLWQYLSAYIYGMQLNLSNQHGPKRPLVTACILLISSKTNRRHGACIKCAAVVEHKGQTAEWKLANTSQHMIDKIIHCLAHPCHRVSLSHECVTYDLWWLS